MRDIAALAGVDAALVVRYFGSKEALFAEAVAGGLDPAPVLEGDRGDLGERLVRSVLLKKEEKGELDLLLALLRSAANERAAAILGEELDKQFLRPLARWLGGERAEERAGSIAACLFGIAFMRIVIRSGPLAENDVEPIVALFAPALQSYVDGESS